MKVSLHKNESLLDGVLKQGRELAHECGGVLACASCVVIVEEGASRLSEPGEDEQDILDRASLSEPGARLACQATGEGEFVVSVPRLDAQRVAAAEGLRPVTLSERAALHFAVQLARRPDAVGVRLSVEPSGCSGFGYRMDFAEEKRAGDAVFESGRLRVLVDPLSLPYVQGTSVDVVQEGLSRRVRYDNPNARHTCGCGESFGT